tara:strand:- start:756 stop:905 length:150 start_codon:yes stop_codon:yes gene_type:complete
LASAFGVLETSAVTATGAVATSAAFFGAAATAAAATDLSSEKYLFVSYF